jgi:hypothetical protein
MKLREVGQDSDDAGQASGDAGKVDFQLLFRDLMTMTTALETAEVKAAQERAKTKRLRLALTAVQEDSDFMVRRLHVLLGVASRAQNDGRAVDSTFLVGALWQIVGDRK